MRIIVGAGPANAVHTDSENKEGSDQFSFFPIHSVLIRICLTPMRTGAALLVACALIALAFAGGAPTPPSAATPSPATPTARWFLVVDDRVDAPPLDVSRAMPASQQADGQSPTAKPTVIVVTAVAVPSSLQSCSQLSIDVPLLRAFPGGIASQSSHPTVGHFWIWRNTPPYGRFTTAVNLAIENWTSSAPAFNATWSPNRELGVYRYTRTLTTPWTSGNTYHIGFFVEQPLYGSGNRVFWIANAPGHFGDLLHPFSYSDAYASWLPNPLNAVLQQNFTLAPNGTVFYSSPGDSIGPALRSVVTIVALSCTVVSPTQTVVPGVVYDYGRGAQLPPPSLISIAPNTGNTIVSPPPPPPSPTVVPPPSPVPAPPTVAQTPTGVVMIPTTSATPVLITALPPPPVPVTRVVPPAASPTLTPQASNTAPTASSVIAAATTPTPTPPGVIQQPPAPDNSSWPAWAIATAVLAGVLILALVCIGILLFIRRRSRVFTLTSGDYNPLEDAKNAIELEDSAEQPLEAFTDKEKAKPIVPAEREVVILDDDENARIEV